MIAPLTVIIACGARKQRGPCAARDLYLGPYFLACRKAAERLAPHSWFILSGKYGFLAPTALVATYDQRIDRPGAISTSALRSQALGLGAGGRLVFLGGARYVGRLREVFPEVEVPLTGLGGIGKQLQRLKEMAR